jgi:hypothetical protein
MSGSVLGSDVPSLDLHIFSDREAIKQYLISRSAQDILINIKASADVWLGLLI